MTLVELLVSMSLAAVVGAAVLTTIVNMERQTISDVERATAIQAAESGLYRMTRELRESYRVHVRDPDAMEVDVSIQGTSLRVRYSCATPHPTQAGLHRCVRTVVGQTGQQVIIDRVINGPDSPAAEQVFRTTAGSNYVTAVITVPAAGEKPVVGAPENVVLQDGFYMRNCDVGC